MQKKVKTVLVTGAAGALGGAVIERFRQGGCRVVAIDRREVNQMPAEVASKNVYWVRADVLQPSTLKEGLKVFQSEIDALVHCVGGFRVAAADEIEPDDFDSLLEVNLKSAANLVREILPGMKQRGFGRLLFVGSQSALHPSAGLGPYAASKAGLHAYTLALAEEVRSLDINVNAVLPSILDTPRNRKDLPQDDPKKWVPLTALADILYQLCQPFGNPIHGALIPVGGRLG